MPWKWALNQVIPRIYEDSCREGIEKKIFLTQARRNTTGCFSAVAPMFKLPAQPLKTNIRDQVELFFVATAILWLSLGTHVPLPEEDGWKGEHHPQYPTNLVYTSLLINRGTI